MDYCADQIQLKKSAVSKIELKNETVSDLNSANILHLSMSQFTPWKFNIYPAYIFDTIGCLKRYNSCFCNTITFVF